MTNFVRPEQQACVYVTMCVQYRFLLQWYNIAHPLCQLLIIARGILLSMGTTVCVRFQYNYIGFCCIIIIIV